MVSAYVLDTNIVSEAMRRNDAVLAQIEEAMSRNDVLYLCPVVHFEATRGILHSGDELLREAYEELTPTWLWDDLYRRDWNMAAELWRRALSMGRNDKDADLLIAAFALNRDAVMVTHNPRHFVHLVNALEDWVP